MPTFRRAELGIARTFQNLQIFREMTVLENVMVGPSSARQAGFVRALLHGPALRAEERTIADKAMALLARFDLAARRTCSRAS